MRVLRPNTLPRHSRAGVPPSGGSHPGASAPTTDPATTYPGLKALASFRLRPCGASARHVRLKPGLRPWPPTINHLDYRSGSALVITLGLLAVLAVLVFAYAFSARTERFAARNARDRVTARQYVDLALAAAMNDINRFTSYQGSPAHFHIWRDHPDFHDVSDVFATNVFTSIDTNQSHKTSDNFFDNFSTNLIPAGLLDEARALKPHWIPIEGVDDAGVTIGTNGYIAYAVINCSGLLDAHCISSNQAAWLQSQKTDIQETDDFLHDRARDTAPGSMLTNYLSLADLTRRNRGIQPPISNLFTWSYDPGPDVTVTNGTVVYSNRDVRLVSKLDVNAWTNGYAGPPSDLSGWSDRTAAERKAIAIRLAEHYRSSNFRDWFADASNRFATIGFAAPEALAWNLVNFMDPDRIPQGPEGHICWQEPWPVEDVPLINEVAVGMVPLEMADDKPNHYAPGVELWFPFATNSITKDDKAQLIVAVYTNWVPEHYAHDPYWTNNVIEPRPKHGIVFTNDIEHMQFGTDTEFVTATLPPPYLSFPVTVTNAVAEPLENDTQYIPLENDIRRLVEYDANAPAEPPPPTFYYLTQTNLFLPLGTATYYTYIQKTISVDQEPKTVWVRSQVTVTNTIHLLARVKLGDHWVDEAAGYHPGGREARTNLLVFTEPCGYEVNDPRRNGHPNDWVRYDATEMTRRPNDTATDSISEYVCTLSGATNAICAPWHLPYGQGLPLVHFNQPLRRAGDIGYIQQPESFPSLGDKTRTITNRWQSICLADPTTLAINDAGFAFSAGSVLEFFTARSANTPVRGLVHFSTTHTNVVGALMADLRTGWGADNACLSDEGIEWMTRAFFEAQSELYARFPIGIGDMCAGFGWKEKEGEFARSPDKDKPLENYTDDVLRWSGSLGSDTKEDLLRDLAERISFRQHVFVVLMAGRTATPSGRISATQRAAAVVLRDAYTGRWKVVAWEWL